MRQTANLNIINLDGHGNPNHSREKNPHPITARKSIVTITTTESHPTFRSSAPPRLKWTWRDDGLSKTYLNKYFLISGVLCKTRRLRRRRRLRRLRGPFRSSPSINRSPSFIGTVLDSKQGRSQPASTCIGQESKCPPRSYIPAQRMGGSYEITQIIVAFSRSVCTAIQNRPHKFFQHLFIRNGGTPIHFVFLNLK